MDSRKARRTRRLMVLSILKGVLLVTRAMLF